MPNQCLIPCHPWCLYVFWGLAGMLAGRTPLVHHAFHSFLPFSLSVRAYATASRKGRYVVCLCLRGAPLIRTNS